MMSGHGVAYWRSLSSAIRYQLEAKMAKSVPETCPARFIGRGGGKTADILNRSTQARDTSLRTSSSNEIRQGKENG